MRVGSTLIALLTLTLAGPVRIVRAEEGTGLPLAVHGFVSPGYILTTNGNKYIADSTDGGSVELTEAGINFTLSIDDRLRVGMQLFTQDRGPVGNYDAKFDWYYLDYRWQDWLGVRAGRIKIPFGLYNETSDIDQARVPVLLPQGVYPFDNRDVLLAQTGGEIYGYLQMCDAGALDYRIYGGTIFLEVEDDPGAQFQVLDLSIPYLFGGRLMWETPLDGLRLGGGAQVLRLVADLRMTQPAPTDIALELDFVMWIASIEYAFGDALVAAEYSRWHSDTKTVPEIVPDDTSASERAYVMFNFRAATWLQLGLYYSLLFTDTDDRGPKEKHQHDVAATLRFDIDEHWLVKLEGHYMNGTAGLSDDLNGRPTAELAEQWAVFILKTTAYF